MKIKFKETYFRNQFILFKKCTSYKIKKMICCFSKKKNGTLNSIQPKNSMQDFQATASKCLNTRFAN